jgi:hypothetical protein
MRPRAQSSVELLIVLAISIILLSVLVDVTTSQIIQLKNSHALKTAQQSLSTLVLAIDQSWAEGPGTVRFVTVRWPEGVDGNRVWIQRNSIILSVYDTNIVGSAIPNLTGALNLYPGEQKVKLTVNDSNVSLGTLSITSDQSSVYIPLEQDSNAATSIVITNLAPLDANVAYTLTWTPALVGLSRSPTTDVLSPNESGELDLNASASATAFGNYVGQLSVDANYGSTTESLIIPINVEVFASSSGFLEGYPSTLVLGALPGDTNTSVIQVCNSGDSALSGITFTPSDVDAGEWVQSISSISSLAANTCQNVNVTVSIPGGSSYGDYSGSLLMGDSTGANTDIIALDVGVFGQADYFAWDWNTTSLGASTLSGFGWRNWGSDPVAITSMIIQRWSECDTNGSTLTGITANGVSVFSGSVSDGGTANVTDFNIPATTAYTNNSLTFNGTINDENEQFQGIVTFSDSTTYTSTAYGVGCGNDITSPAQVNDLVAFAGAEPGTIRLQFTLPGDNNYSGTATEAEIKMFRQPDANTPSVYANGTILSYGSIGPGGTTGSLTVTDLNVGETYFFTAVFRDEVDNNGGLSNIASGRPWNRFRWTGNDFNITNFAHSLSTSPPVGQPWDVNLFTVSDFNFGSNRDRNIQFRVTPDNNSDNSWIIYIGIQSTVVNSIKIWYPIAAQDSLPAQSPDYSSNPGASASSPLDLLSASLINSTYRYDGSSVSVPRPNHLYVSWMRNINDFNLMFDMNQALYS